MSQKWKNPVIKTINIAAKNLNEREHLQILKDIELTCEHLVNPRISIGVLAPFNFGKSSLINAIFGREIMPTKAIRTTGTVISIRYGKTLTTIITLKSGKIVKSNDIEILKDFAVLDRKGKRRDDVMSVEVLYPHKLLKKGIELFDLPGTNDSEEQDKLVRDKLLGIDIVIQVLNARQSFTLEEQNKLHKWLISRGIRSIIFVINRMNEVEPEDQEEVYDDVYSMTKGFQSDLPQGCKNLYCVDALPAINAKKEKSIRKMYTSGIIDFETTLLTLLSIQKNKINKTRLIRAIVLCLSIKPLLHKKAGEVSIEIKEAENIRQNIVNKGKQRERNLRKELKLKVQSYQNWLNLKHLKGRYQIELSEALEQGQISTWQNQKLIQNILTYTTDISTWINQYCQEFYKIPPKDIDITFPKEPTIFLPASKERNPLEVVGDFFNGNANRRRLDKEYEREKWKSYKNAAYKYLSKFSKKNNNNLNEYHKKCESIITFQIPQKSKLILNKKQELIKINNSIAQIQSLVSLQNKLNLYKFKNIEKFKFKFLYWINFLFCFLKS